jgi:hypothetical protein
VYDFIFLRIIYKFKQKLISIEKKVIDIMLKT